MPGVLGLREGTSSLEGCCSTRFDAASARGSDGGHYERGFVYELVTNDVYKSRSDQ